MESTDVQSRRSLLAIHRVQHCLEVIDALEPDVRATITVMAESARADAHQCDQAASEGRWLGVLHGMPIAIKDNIDTAGIRTTAGSRVFADHVPREDAVVVARLRAAGAIAVLKANMAELALGGGTPTNPFVGDCRNPWDLARIPGGSSSGSAAAVAAGMVTAALGTDTGASIRGPAAMTGLVGLRPTLGRVPTRGVRQNSLTLDTVGPMAHSAVDVARMLAAIEGYDAADPTSQPRRGDDVLGQLNGGIEGMRIGIPRAFFFDELHPEVGAAIDEALEVLARLGAILLDVELEGAERTIEMTQRILHPQAAMAYARYLDDSPELIGPYARERLQRGRQTMGAELAGALAWRSRWIRCVADRFGDVDLLLTPMIVLPPPPADIEDLHELSSRLLRTANAWALAGVPAASVPCGTAEGLPTAFQLVGPAWHDGRVLRAVHAYQQATDWHQRRPPLTADVPLRTAEPSAPGDPS